MTRTMVNFDLKTIGGHMARRKNSRPTALVYPYLKGKADKLPRGVWLGRYHLYVDGKRKAVDRILDRALAERSGLCRDTTGPLGKSEARALLEQIISAELSAPADRPADVTLGDFAQQYLTAKKPTWEKRTVITAENLIQTHIIKPLGARVLKDIDYFTLQEHVNKLVAAGNGYSLLQKVVYYLRAIFEEAAEADLIQRNPARKVKHRLKREHGNVHTPAECQRLYAAAIGREHLMLRLLIQLGLRGEEAFALRHDDVEPGRLRIDEAFIEAEVKGTKTEESGAFMHITPSLEAELREWMAAAPLTRPTAWLFPATRGGCPFTPKNYLRRVLKPLAARANVANVTFQSLRRTSGTHVAKHASNVKDVQAHMRHSNIATTMDTYVQPIAEGVRAAQEAWERELGGTIQ